MADIFQQEISLTAAEKAELMALLAKAIEELPPDERAACILRYVKQLPNEAIARRLNISIDEVRARCERALVRCRVRMGPRI